MRPPTARLAIRRHLRGSWHGGARLDVGHGTADFVKNASALGSAPAGRPARRPAHRRKVAVTWRSSELPTTRFEGLPDFPFDPHYAEIPDQDGGTLRVHYLDEGPADGQVVVLLHGEPSWSFLYRHMVPVLVGAGLRTIAPDLVGFGRSDKPTPRSEYTFARHVEWMRSLLFDRLDHSEVTLVCQDWGGLIGLRLVAEHADRFARVVAANTFLPTGDERVGEAFLAWLKFSQEVEVFPTGVIVNTGCTTDLSPEVMAGYDAPFPDQRCTEGARQFPTLVPIRPDDPASEANRAAWEVLRRFEPPVPHRVQRRRPDHRGIGPRAAGTDPRRQGSAAHHHRGRRPLPPGGQGARAGAGGRRLRPRHLTSRPRTAEPAPRAGQPREGRAYWLGGRPQRARRRARALQHGSAHRLLPERVLLRRDPRTSGATPSARWSRRSSSTTSARSATT